MWGSSEVNIEIKSIFYKWCCVFVRVRRITRRDVILLSEQYFYAVRFFYGKFVLFQLNYWQRRSCCNIFNTTKRRAVNGTACFRFCAPRRHPQCTSGVRDVKKAAVAAGTGKKRANIFGTNAAALKITLCIPKRSAGGVGRAGIVCGYSRAPRYDDGYGCSAYVITACRLIPLIRLAQETRCTAHDAVGRSVIRTKCIHSDEPAQPLRKILARRNESGGGF